TAVPALVTEPIVTLGQWPPVLPGVVGSGVGRGPLMALLGEKIPPPEAALPAALSRNATPQGDEFFGVPSLVEPAAVAAVAPPPAVVGGLAVDGILVVGAVADRGVVGDEGVVDVELGEETADGAAVAGLVAREGAAGDEHPGHGAVHVDGAAAGVR